MSSKKKSKREKMQRILAIVMVVLMVLSICGTLIYQLTLGAFALEDIPEATETVQVDPTADDKLIRVGLMYGDNVTVGFETNSPYGFTVNSVKSKDDYSHEPLWELDNIIVSCIPDANLSKTNMTYLEASGSQKTAVGGWHAEIGIGFAREEAELLIEVLNPSLSEIGVYAIPAYIDGMYCIRAGHFINKELAEACAQKILEYFPDLPMRAAGPSDTGVALVDPSTDRILFEYDGKDETALGLTAHPSPQGERAYLVTPAKKLYDGVFMFRRHRTETANGVSLTNILPLGEYIKGVLPYEISSSWPIESQKAFAICVRSFTLTNINRHQSSYGFDVCNTSHCQVYNGRNKVTETIEQVADATCGLILAGGGAIIPAYYSAVTGGVTVGSDDAWGGKTNPYLTAIETPWEIYTNHSNGVWTTEVSGKELCTYLRESKGYTNLRGEIKSITIDELAKNSTYIKQITFTDSYGTKVTIKYSDIIRTALSKYVKSASFVVGKGEVKAEKTTFHTVAADSLRARVKTGILGIQKGASTYAMSASGLVPVSLEESKVITKNATANLTGTTPYTETVTIYAQNKNNFIFAGKGWGHGVGLSQLGLRDLANLGYGATDILRKYFTGAEIVDWREILGK